MVNWQRLQGVGYLALWQRIGRIWTDEKGMDRAWGAEMHAAHK